MQKFERKTTMNETTNTTQPMEISGRENKSRTEDVKNFPSRWPAKEFFLVYLNS